MIKSKIYHRVLLFEIQHVENHGIVQTIAVFRINSQERKNLTVTVFVTQLHKDQYFNCDSFLIAYILK